MILELDNPSTVTNINIYGLGRQLARRTKKLMADSLNTLVMDYLGTVRSSVRANQGPSDVCLEYYPYGQRYSWNGANSAHRTFIGKEDDLTGQLDFGPRYYGATEGRFLAPDPILSGASPYAYAEGNPVMLSDPSGMMTAYPEMRPGTQEYRDWLDGVGRAAQREMARERAQYQYHEAHGNKYTYVSATGQQHEVWSGASFSLQPPKQGYAGRWVRPDVIVGGDGGLAAFNEESGLYDGTAHPWATEQHVHEGQWEYIADNWTAESLADVRTGDSGPTGTNAGELFGAAVASCESVSSPILVGGMMIGCGGVVVGAGILCGAATWWTGFGGVGGIACVVIGSGVVVMGLNIWVCGVNSVTGLDIPTLHDLLPFIPDWPE